MSNFICDKCGSEIIDGPHGYITGCPHYPLSRVELLRYLADYPVKTACIWYRDGSGVVKTWFIAAHPEKDNEETLRAHLRKHLPASEFIGGAIK